MAGSTPVNRTTNIYINHASAERSLKALETQSRKLKQSIEEGEKAGRDMTAELSKLSTVNQKISDLNNIISGKFEPTLNQVKRRAQELRRELDAMSKSAPGYAARFDEFQKVTKRLNEMQAATSRVNTTLEKGTKSGKGFFGSLRGMGDQIKSIAVGTLVGNTITAAVASISSYISNIVKSQAALSDSLSDIRKTTGLTNEQVVALNKELSKLDTRTATAELRNIAIAFGQLGEEPTARAIASLDKINVALGDEFGGNAQEIANILGILRNNLTDLRSQDFGADILKIGNALNELGANGLATAPVVTDFANRMAGVARTFGVSSGQILGLSAALQEVGVNVERGATAVTRLMQKMAGDTAAFAAVVRQGGGDAQEFARLVNTDMVAALQMFAKYAKEAGSNNQAFATLLKDVDADGAGVSEVLAKMAENSALFADKMNLATDALTKGDSIMAEFNEKNTNLAAQLDKLGKQFASVLSSPAITQALLKIITGVGVLLEQIKTLSEFIGRNSTVIKIWTGLLLIQLGVLRSLATALGINTAAITANGIATAATTVLMRSFSITVGLTNIAMGLLTLSFARVRAGFLALAAGLGTNPLGALLVVTGALIIAFDQLAQKGTKLSAQFRVMNDVMTEAAKRSIEQENNIKRLVRVLNDESASLAAKQRALKDLIALDPQYLSGLTQANVTTAAGVTIINDYIAALRQKAKAEALQQKSVELAKEELDVTRDLTKANREWSQTFNRSTGSPIGQFVEGVKGFFGSGVTARMNDLRGRLEDIHEEAKFVNEELYKITTTNPTTSPTTAGTPTTPPSITPFSEKEKEKLVKTIRQTKDEYTQFLQEIHRIRRELDLAEQEDDEAAFNRVQEKYARLLKEARKYATEENGIIVEILRLRDQEVSKLLQDQRDKQQDEALKDAKSNGEQLADEFIKGVLSGLSKPEHKEAWVSELERFIQLGTQVNEAWQALNYAFDAADDRRLGKFQKQSDQRIAQWDKELKEKRITQSQYDKLTLEQQRQMDEKEREVKKKKFNRDKALALSQAAVQVARAILEGYAQSGPFGGTAGAAIAAAVGAIQIGVIAASQPPEYQKGGVANGPSHAGGGISMINSQTGQKVGEMEGGEPYMILSGNTYKNNKPLVDDLLHSSMYGNGRRLRAMNLYQPMPAFNKGGVTHALTARAHYANGGIFNPQNATDNARMEQQIMDMSASIDRLSSVLERGIHADVLLSDIERKNKEQQLLHSFGQRRQNA